MNGEWETRSFGDFGLAFKLASAPDGARAQVNLFIFDQPLQSFSLSAREPTGDFDLKLRGYVARGEVKFWLGPGGQPCLSLTRLWYGPTGQLAEVTDYVLECLSTPPPPPPPDPVTPDEPESAGGEFVEGAGRHHDLFPFLYVYPWPQVSAEQLNRRFVVYDGKNTAANSLYCALVHVENPSEPCGSSSSSSSSSESSSSSSSESSSSSSSGSSSSSASSASSSGSAGSSSSDPSVSSSSDSSSSSSAEDARCAMELTANAFLEGRPPFEGQFVDDMSSLIGPIRDFGLIDEWLRTDPAEISNEDLLRFVEELLREPIDEYVVSPAYLTQKERLWQSLFALMIILGYRTALLEQITTTLVMCRLVERIGAGDPALVTTEGILEAARATILLPSKIFPLPPAGGHVPPPTPRPDGWVKPYALGDLKIVRHGLLRYELGEVARIEGILRSERKEATWRKLRRVEESATAESSRAERDDSETLGNRAELLREMQRMIAQESVTTTFSNLTTNYGTPTTATLSGSWSVDRSQPPAPQPSRQARARNFAQDITTRTADRLARKAVEQRTFSTLDEAEETVVHTFDNKDGAGNVVGIYRWVNKVYWAQMGNYGRRLLIEFIVPRPARDYIARSATLRGVTLAEPTPPENLAPPLGPVKSYEQITRANYAALAALYHAREITAPPAEVSVAATTLRGGAVAQTTEVAVPDGYRAAEASVTYVLTGGSGFGLWGLVGSNLFSVPALPASSSSLSSSSGNSNFTPPSQCTPTAVSAGNIQAGTQCLKLNGEDSFIPVSLMELQTGSSSSSGSSSTSSSSSSSSEASSSSSSGSSSSSDESSSSSSSSSSSPSASGGSSVSAVGDALAVYDYGVQSGGGYGYLVNIEVQCVLSDETFAVWQIKTYEAILRGYRQLKAEYYAQSGSMQTGPTSDNPLENREVEKIELKRGCEKLLLEQFYELVGRDTSAACALAPSQFVVNELMYLQFFEQVFEWGEMVYYFYVHPEGGADAGGRIPTPLFPDLDSLFTSFLQADAARVVLPVRPSFDLRVLLFLATGMIWEGGDSLAPAVEENLSLVNELKEVCEAGAGFCPEGEAWEVVVPTSMTMLQGGAQLPRFKPAAGRGAGKDSFTSRQATER